MLDRVQELLDTLEALPENEKTSYTEGMRELAEMIVKNDRDEINLYIQQYKKLLKDARS